MNGLGFEIVQRSFTPDVDPGQVGEAATDMLVLHSARRTMRVCSTTKITQGVGQGVQRQLELPTDDN
jgi:hypothetical protein